MKTIYIAILSLLVTTVFAQDKSFIVTNLTVHIGNGKVIEKGAIGVKNGKIDAVGAELKASDYKKTIDGKGQHAYPSVIAPNTQLGLVEMEAVRATNDFREVGYFNANIRSLIAYNTDSDVTPTVRSNGILLIQIVPKGGRMSGQSSIMVTEGDNYEDAVLAADNGMHLNWPNRFQFSGWWAAPGPTKLNKNYDRDLEGVKLFMDGAFAYSQKAKVEQKNIKFEAMKGVFDQSKKLYVHVDDAKSMMEAYELLKGYKASLVFVGAEEAWRIASFLKEKNISVILSNVHSLPNLEHDDVNQPYKTPAILQKAGVKFALSMDGSWNQRNLMFQAGQAASYGLDKEAAVSSITLNAAEIMGIADRVGSLEKGKDATFIISKGDLLDMRSSLVTDAYLFGKQVDIANDKQKKLYKKYMDKYELEER